MLKTNKNKSEQKNLSKLKKQADAEWSRYIRYRDGYYDRGQWWVTCITCGQEKPLKEMQCGHFVSRRVNVLRFDERNTNGQCVSCNMFNQGEQYLYSINVDLKYGPGTAKELMGQRFRNHKFTIQELEDIIAYAKEKTKEYEEARGSLGYRWDDSVQLFADL